uniref:Prefoldin subunit 4 n=1 Tax=Suricata suricatta TaxID=37032 RepID=A0A673UL06_SURSU
GWELFLLLRHPGSGFRLPSSYLWSGFLSPSAVKCSIPLPQRQFYERVPTLSLPFVSQAPRTCATLGWGSYLPCPSRAGPSSDLPRSLPLTQAAEDVNVTFEDQQKINKFARNTSRITELKEEIEVKKKQLQNLEDACEDIMLADDDCLMIPYQIGDVFISHSQEETQEMLEEAKVRGGHSPGQGAWGCVITKTTLVPGVGNGGCRVTPGGLCRCPGL